MSVQDSISTIDPDSSLGDLVNQVSARARVFERYGVDYCCHGQRSLKDAATEAKIDLNLLQAELLKVDTVADPVAALHPSALVMQVEATHHKYLWEELPLLEALAQKIHTVHGANHPELARVSELVQLIRNDLEPHLREEEETVFPAIQAYFKDNTPVESAQIDKLRSEHEQLGLVLAELREVANNYELPADACASYTMLYQRLAELESDTFRHIHLENNVIFPQLSV